MMKNVRKRELVLFLGPALFFYCVFFVYPMVETIKLSFYETSNNGIQNFVGLKNFDTLINDPFFNESFFNALWNNLIFFLFHMFLQNPIGILLALLLVNLSFKSATFYRTAVMLPTMLSFVIVGFIWQLILSPTWGITGILYEVFGAGNAPALLGEENSALITLSLVSVWQFIGIPVLLIYASLISIDKDILEAVKLEKVSFFKAFFHVHLPMIWPTIALVSILTYVNNFNAFDLVYTVKGALAGPNFSTDLLGTLFYRTFFGFQLQSGNINLGATVATFMFLIILIGVSIYLFFVQRRILR